MRRPALYLLARLGVRLSVLGEARGWGWLTYNPLLFAHFHLIARDAAPALADAIADALPGVRRVADVGAGSAAYSAALRQRGFEPMAFERSRIGRASARIQRVASHPFDHVFQSKYKGAFDVALCLEVAEHLPPAAGAELVGALATIAPVVVFSAAVPGQGGHGHINEQPPDYWRQAFLAGGMTEAPPKSSAIASRLAAGPDWLAGNVMVFER